MAAPTLVRDLLEDGRERGGDPRAGSVPLSATCRLVDARERARALAAVVADRERVVPVAVFTHADGDAVERTMRRAERTARHLAGVCSVHAVRPDCLDAFNRAVEERMRVWGGAARLYLPSDLPPTRHRFLRRDALEGDPGAAARIFGLVLSQSIASRRSPPFYEPARRLPRRARGGSADDVLGLLETELEEREAELAERKAELATQQDLYIDLAADKEEADREIEELRRRMKYLLRRPNEAPEEHDAAAPAAFPAHVDDLSHAAAFCREHLDRVALPEGACRDLDVLDRSPGSIAWGQTSLKGLFALDADAREKAQRGFDGNFWSWCRDSGNEHAWPATPKKLAMSESETVMCNDQMRSCRVLPVDPSVDPSGSILMQAHLKVAEGGGDLAPRIYFHDDTGGPTGKVHIGFFGPHRHMPNTRTG